MESGFCCLSTRADRSHRPGQLAACGRQSLKRQHQPWRTPGDGPHALCLKGCLYRAIQRRFSRRQGPVCLEKWPAARWRVEKPAAQRAGLHDVCLRRCLRRSVCQRTVCRAGQLPLEQRRRIHRTVDVREKHGKDVFTKAPATPPTLRRRHAPAAPAQRPALLFSAPASFARGP